MLTFLLLLLLLSLYFILRVRVRYLVTGKSFDISGYTGDAMGYLLLIDEIRKNGHRLKGCNQRFLLSGGVGKRPMFLYWILSYIPSPVMKKIEPFFNIIVDIMHIVVIYLFSTSLLQYYGFYNPGLWALAVCILFMFCPLLWDHLGRACFFSGRNIGFLFGNIFFLSLIYYFTISDSYVILAVSFIGFFAASFVGFFSLQAVVFISLFWGIISLNIDLILVLFTFNVITFIPLLMTGMLRYHVCLLLRVSTELMHKYPDTAARKVTLKSLMDFLKAVVSFKLEQMWVKSCSIPLVRGIIFCPSILLVLLLPLFSDLVMHYWTLYSFSIASILVFFVISLNPLRFLGEAERYLEYFIAPSLLCIIILLGAESMSTIFAFALCFLLFSVVSSIHIKLHISRNLIISMNSVREIIHFFKNVKTSSVYAIGRLSRPIAYETNHSFLCELASAFSDEHMRNDYIFFYGDGLKFNNRNKAMHLDMMRRYDIEYLLMPKALQEAGIEEDSWAVVFENNVFIVFKRREYAHPA